MLSTHYQCIYSDFNKKLIEFNETPKLSLMNISYFCNKTILSSSNPPTTILVFPISTAKIILLSPLCILTGIHFLPCFLIIVIILYQKNNYNYNRGYYSYRKYNTYNNNYYYNKRGRGRRYNQKYQ